MIVYEDQHLHRVKTLNVKTVWLNKMKTKVWRARTTGRMGFLRTHWDTLHKHFDQYLHENSNCNINRINQWHNDAWNWKHSQAECVFRIDPCDWMTNSLQRTNVSGNTTCVMPRRSGCKTFTSTDPLTIILTFRITAIAVATWRREGAFTACIACADATMINQAITCIPHGCSFVNRWTREPAHLPLTVFVFARDIRTNWFWALLSCLCNRLSILFDQGALVTISVASTCGRILLNRDPIRSDEAFRKKILREIYACADFLSKAVRIVHRNFRVEERS